MTWWRAAGRARDLADLRAELAYVPPGAKVLPAQTEFLASQAAVRGRSLPRFNRMDDELAAVALVERHAFWASHGGHRNQGAVANAAAAEPRSTGDVIGALSAQMGHYGKNSAIDMSIPPIVGAPDTVIRRIQAIAAIGHIGRFDLVFRAGRLPEELVETSMQLFGKEVMPVLQKAAA